MIFRKAEWHIKNMIFILTSDWKKYIFFDRESNQKQSIIFLPPQFGMVSGSEAQIVIFPTSKKVKWYIETRITVLANCWKWNLTRTSIIKIKNSIKNNSSNIFPGPSNLTLFWAVRIKMPGFQTSMKLIRYQKHGLGGRMTEYNCFIVWHEPWNLCLRSGARPTSGISIEFELRSKYGAL